MQAARYTFRTKLWLYPGMAAWHFVTVPKRISLEIRERFGASARGFGSQRVTVTIGNTGWKTSIFPDRATRTYLLPIKAAVRRAEGLEAGKTAAVTIEVGMAV